MPRPRPSIDRTIWVDAAPFGAHLTQLCALTGVGWQELALRAGVPLRLAARLTGHGGGSGRLRRIPRQVAEQLWALTLEEVDELKRTSVLAESTCSRVGFLLASGVALPRLAAQLGCSPAFVADLADHRPTHVSALIALRAAAAREMADGFRSRVHLSAA
ncbi:MAG: hypothetical protein Q4F65_03150 [Propionibacteriaceae bacterium]|nr:hypothetical protein [Propionibacteriaceae bacterium]